MAKQTFENLPEEKPKKITPKKVPAKKPTKATMAAAKRKVLKRPNVLQETINELIEGVKGSLPDEKSRLQFLIAFGVGNTDTTGEYYTCNRCGKLLPVGEFYISTEVGILSHIAPICKKCSESLAFPVIDGAKQSPTKESVIAALESLRKPYLESLWESSLLEAANATSKGLHNNVWASYIKNVQMTNYYGLNHTNSDFYETANTAFIDNGAMSKDQEIIDTFEKNKADTLRLLGYLPFEKEKLSDQPFLYAQLLGFLDASEDQNDDMMRTSSIISIVRGFLQQSQIDDMIAQLVQDTRNAAKNVATIKALQAMKSDVTMTIVKLAQESCISLKNTKNAKKGENSWTGKLKRIKDLNLREGEVNGFDLNTCKGMMQVMEMSDASIMRQLHLDESEWSDMVAEQRVMIRDMQKKLDFYAEAARLILRENIDLRDTLTEAGLLNEDNLIDLEELYSPFIAAYKEAEKEEEMLEDVLSDEDELSDEDIDDNTESDGDE